MNKSFKNKNIFISGASGKLGKKLALKLMDQGANVFLLVRDINKISEFSSNNKAKIIEMDFCNAESMREFIEYVTTNSIFMDAFVHAGVYRPGQINHHDYASFLEDSLSTNSSSSIYLISEIAKIMARQGGGSIVNVGSIYGKIAPDFRLYDNLDMGTEPDYAFIKAGTASAVRYYASLYGKYNVRLNTIILGGVFNNQPEEFVNRYIQKVPLNRMAKDSDFISGCLFLLSDDSSYITGTELVIDGGLTAL